MSREKILIEHLQAECERLREENTFLRNLLEIKVHEPLVIPKENSVRLADTEKPKILPISNTVDKEILTTAKKIALFRTLFHGREDVYALRWEGKEGRSGYSPVCANEWDRRVCRKPKIKCSECSYSKWRPLTDQVIHDHLTGKHMIGVYPLLKDETCHFLAIDFDKATWREDALSFINTCRQFSIPAILERSQSGNGAHVWIFFSEPTPARIARSLGTGLLTQTMQARHVLSLDSYDRLFPSQDTLPKGGFGNLIALPLQGDRRKLGNSIFLNDGLEPYLDPWPLLKELRPLSQNEIYVLLEKINQKGDLLDIRMSNPEEEKLDPWVSPKRKTGLPEISESIPKRLELVKANLIYVQHRMLPAALTNQIKKIAAFQNPEFYRAQSMRLSTYGKPRIINCVEEFPEFIGLPRGCEEDLLNLLNHYKIKIDLRDETQKGKSIAIDFIGELGPDQIKAFKALLSHQYGILAATTAFGKTVIAAKMIAERKINTLILVHRQQLLEQWRERLCSFLGLQMKDIGVLGGGRNKLTGNIDIAMLQSLSKKEVVKEEVTHYGQVIVDECHHISAFSFEKVLKKINAHYVLGLTATLTRKDGHHPIILMQCGPIRHSVSGKNHLNNSQITPKVTVCQTTFNLPNNPLAPLKISDIYEALTNHEERNEQIFNDVLMALEKKRTPLLLTERTHHLDWFSERFRKFVKHVFVLRGGMKSSERTKILQALASFPSDEERLILATGPYIGEGFDDPRLDTLFLALPISWQGKLQQYVGRLHRIHENKTDVLVYDYVDSQVPMLNKMYQKRLKKYRAMGYEVNHINN